MTRYLLIVIFMIATALVANPLPSILVQQIYFDANEDLIMQLGYLCASFAGGTLTVSDGTNTASYTILEDDFQNYPVDVNLSTLMPDLNVCCESGYLSFDNMNPYDLEEVRWGYNDDCDVTPLTGSQSIYQYYDSRHNGWESYTVKTWAKSDSPDNVQDYCCNTHATVHVYIENNQSEPVEGAKIFYMDDLNLCCLTDAAGNATIQLGARNTLLSVKAPDASGDALCWDRFFLEPNQVLELSATIDYSSVDDSVIPEAGAALMLKPSVLRPGNTMLVEYGKALESKADLNLYDIKGRFIRTVNYREALSYDTQGLSSGIYFLRLMQGTRILATKKFILLR
ncbi:MAG: T9SS type A sorting domain-containing protein [Candidatus Cloacimonetes bacterium]|nr:T9SS type A sorting domain-containing protein [Candidatus Cloacimonadota bacterium]MDD2506898.1 T9SS type A sorting domain-containing protein [Candidatus Cloacimonadota bacterium]